MFPASKHQVLTKLFSEENVFSTTHTIQVQDENVRTKTLEDLELVNMTENGACMHVTSE
jgi:hypothetical protein